MHVSSAAEKEQGFVYNPDNNFYFRTYPSLTRGGGGGGRGKTWVRGYKRATITFVYLELAPFMQSLKWAGLPLHLLKTYILRNKIGALCTSYTVQWIRLCIYVHVRSWEFFPFENMSAKISVRLRLVYHLSQDGGSTVRMCVDWWTISRSPLTRFSSMRWRCLSSSSDLSITATALLTWGSRTSPSGGRNRLVLLA